jgi:hypothetical protein
MILNAVVAATFTMVVAFAWAGLVTVAAGACIAGNRWRSAATVVVVGVVLFASVFGVLAQSHADVALSYFVLGLGTSVGLAIQVPVLVKASSRAVPLAVFVGVIGVIRVMAAFVPINFTALDPYHYAFGAATIFSDGWMHQNYDLPPETLFWLDTIRVSRAPAIAMLWPLAAFQIGITINDVFAQGTVFLLFAGVLIFDALDGFLNRVWRVAITAAGLGALNTTTLLVGGQINQCFAILVLTGLVWIARYSTSERFYLGTVVMSAYAVGAGYPEMLLAVPLYIAGGILLRGATWQRIWQTAVGALVGIALVQLITRFQSISYLVSQTSSRPGWYPLVHAPTNGIEAWSIIATGFFDGWGLLALLTPVTFIAVLPNRICKTVELPRTVTQALLVSLVPFVGLITWAVVQSVNTNYTTFKIAGWLGPAAAVVLWVLATRARSWQQTAACALVLSLGILRLLTIAVEVPFDLQNVARVPPAGPTWQPESTSRSGVTCVIRPGADDYVSVIIAVAESSAPTRGCRLDLSY